MIRSRALALSGAALLAVLSSPSSAQSLRSGMQCVPDVPNVSMYHNCRLQIVAGGEVCRCAIRPQALRRTDRIRNQDQDDAVTGSINRSPIVRGSQSGADGGRGGNGSIGGGAVSGGGVAGGGSIGGGSTGGTTGPGSGGAVADNGNGVGNGGTVGNGNGSTGGNAGGGASGGNNAGGNGNGPGNGNGNGNGHGGGQGNNGYGNGGGDGSPNGKDDTNR